MNPEKSRGCEKSNQVVVFYGSNSRDYTRLGKITGVSAGELRELPGNGNVSITLF